MHINENRGTEEEDSRACSRVDGDMPSSVFSRSHTDTISTLPIVRAEPPPRVSAIACTFCGTVLPRPHEPCPGCYRSRLFMKLVLVAFLCVTIGLAAVMVSLVVLKAADPGDNVPVAEVRDPAPSQSNQSEGATHVVSKHEAGRVGSKDAAPSASTQVDAVTAASAPAAIDPSTEGTDQARTTEQRVLEGAPESQLVLAERYYRGDGVPVDRAKALSIFMVLAEGGDETAQLNVAKMYENGDGVPRDISAAVNWYRAAAETGNRIAQNKLAILLYEGKVVRRDLREAVDWYRKSANQGYHDAQYNLGILYFNGEGVPQDLAEAHLWIGRAAKNGNAMAYYWIGQMFASGTGVAADPEEALRWLQRAADAGYEPAKKPLSILLSRKRARH